MSRNAPVRPVLICAPQSCTGQRKLRASWRAFSALRSALVGAASGTRLVKPSHTPDPRRARALCWRVAAAAAAPAAGRPLPALLCAADTELLCCTSVVPGCTISPPRPPAEVTAGPKAAGGPAEPNQPAWGPGAGSWSMVGAAKGAISPDGRFLELLPPSKLPLPSAPTLSWRPSEGILAGRAREDASTPSETPSSPRAWK